MKNRFFVAIVIAVVAASLVMALASCDQGLPAPENVSVRGNTLSWDTVQGAEYYEITVEGDGYSDSGRSETGLYTLSIEDPGRYTITVTAYDADGNAGEPLVFVYTLKQRLESPQVTFDAAAMTLNWGAVDGAIGYSVRIWDGTLSRTDEDALLSDETVETTSYALDPEKYGGTGSYEIEVAALADADGNFSDSNYCDAIDIVNDEQLAVPEISDVSSRIRWTTVPNASGYEVRLVNRSTGTEYTYSTTSSSSSTTASVALTSFGITEAGAYDIYIRAVGDGSVYLDSDWSEASTEFAVYKLADFDEASAIAVEISTEEDGTVRQILKFTVTAAQRENVEKYVVDVMMLDGEGNEVSANNRKEIVLSESTSDWSVTEKGDGSAEYRIDLDTIFFDGEGGLTLRESYYGRVYNVQIYAARTDSDGVINSTTATADGHYISYIEPDTDSDGYYAVNNAGELSYMRFDPDGRYRLYSNIDFGGYLWMTVDEFSGVLENASAWIIEDAVFASETDKLGFVGTLASGASISDIVIAGATAESDEGKLVGLLVAENAGSVRNCFVTGTVSAVASVAGGLVGENNGTISGSAAYADVTAAVAGGLVAVNNADGVISYSSAMGTITAEHTDTENTLYGTADGAGAVRAGGFVAENAGSVVYCSFEGNVSANNSVAGNTVLAGGFVAYNSGTVSLSYSGANYSENAASRNTVSAASSTTYENIAAGGFVGYNAVGATVSSCYANVRASAAHAGGFAGINDGSVSDSYSIGGVAVNAPTRDGFAGGGSGTMSNCLFYDRDLTGESTVSGVTRVSLAAGADFSEVGRQMAAALGGNFAFTDGAKNAVLANHWYISVGSRLMDDVAVGETVELTAWRAEDGQKVEYVYSESSDDCLYFGREEGDRQTAGEYAIRFRVGNFVLFVGLTVTN